MRYPIKFTIAKDRFGECSNEKLIKDTSMALRGANADQNQYTKCNYICNGHG